MWSVVDRLPPTEGGSDAADVVEGVTVGRNRGRLIPLILLYKPQALHKYCPEKSRRHRGVWTDPQLAHSRQSRLYGGWIIEPVDEDVVDITLPESPPLANEKG